MTVPFKFSSHAYTVLLNYRTCKFNKNDFADTQLLFIDDNSMSTTNQINSLLS